MKDKDEVQKYDVNIIPLNYLFFTLSSNNSL